MANERPGLSSKRHEIKKEKSPGESIHFADEISLSLSFSVLSRVSVFILLLQLLQERKKKKKEKNSTLTPWTRSGEKYPKGFVSSFFSFFDQGQGQ